jgi:hypothetical protein
MISALKCPCKAGFLLPQNSLEKTSEWVCQIPKCKNTIKAEEVIDILNRYITGSTTSSSHKENKF